MRTVDAIVEAAARVLEEVGLDAYNTNAIAQRAGTSIGSLYQYFSGKDAITVALIKRESDLLATEVAEAAALQNWREAIRCMAKAAVRHQLHRPRLARLLDIEERRLSVDAARLPAGDIIRAAVKSVLQGIPDMQKHDLETCIADILAITRAVTDTADDQPSDWSTLEARVCKAVFGYLAHSE